MEVISEGRPCPPGPGVAATIGFFDGVHLGHQLVIDAARRLADDRGVRTAVVTFDRHPALVVRPESAPLLLTDLDQRLERLDEAGVDLTLVLTFDEARSRESAGDFVAEVLVECLGARAVVVGADFHFGHQRRGNVELLRTLGIDHGFEVFGLELARSQEATVDGIPISSTAIRRSLSGGDLATANAMLGRQHELRGVVGRGDGRGGALLGYPTANVVVPPGMQLPAAGIYAGWYVRPGGTPLPSAISLGRRPTFAPSGEGLLLEAHILDFTGDLYGETAAVRFVARLRDEERFESVEALVAQMDRDVVDARGVLSEGANR